jgi:hypothetical protein
MLHKMEQITVQSLDMLSQQSEAFGYDFQPPGLRQFQNLARTAHADSS